MNRIEFIGRVTRNIQVKEYQSGDKFAHFNLAINRPKKKNGDIGYTNITRVAMSQGGGLRH